MRPSSTKRRRRPCRTRTWRTFRGLSILNVDPEQARELKAQDPAVKIGRLAVKVIPWIVPAGAVSFSRTRFPRSVAEADA
jgi:hypothetical protein